MPTIQECIEATRPLFERSEAALPEAPPISAHWQRKIEAMEANGLRRQAELVKFEQRCDQAARFGFTPLQPAEMVEMLMGQPHTYVRRGEPLPLEYVYNHHTDAVEQGQNCPWERGVRIFVRQGWRGMIGGEARAVWRCCFASPDHLTITIPYGVALKMLEVKQLRLFNTFNILAPIEAWQENVIEKIDPILAGAVWQITRNPDTRRGGLVPGKIQDFFIAQW